MPNHLGYTFSFRLRIAQETNINENRGSFFVKLYSDDEWGTMIYFQPDEIFTSQADFGSYPRAEATTYTTTSFVDYDVVINGNTYSLYANDSQILTGSLKNYVADLVSKGYSTGYPRVQVGDSTSGASGIVDIAYMELSGDGVTPPVNPVPEPTTIVLVSLALVGIIRKNRIK